MQHETPHWRRTYGSDEGSQKPVMRIPLEGGGRLVVELNQEEARNLADVLNTAVTLLKK